MEAGRPKNQRPGEQCINNLSDEKWLDSRARNLLILLILWLLVVRERVENDSKFSGLTS